MRKLFIIGIFALLLISLVAGTSRNDSKNIETLTLGYCPAMKNLAENIALNNNFVLIEQLSSAEALINLKNGIVDVALIGRLAENNEIINASEKRLTEGYTLVNSVKRLIQKSDLNNITIHTAVNPSIARELLPDANILFYDSTIEAVNNGLNEAVLINWDDYSNNMELLVVMKGYEKDPSFRIPVLYSINNKLDNLLIQ